MARSSLLGLLASFHRRSLCGSDDGELLRRFVQQRDEVAFQDLIERHGPMVLSVAERLTRHAQDAEDAFQATFLIFARQAHKIRHPESLAGWLHRTVRRVVSRQRPRAWEPLNVDVAQATSSPTEPDELDKLDHAIAGLAERHRRVVILCYLEGRTTEEAATMLGIPRGTVLSRLSTARSRLATKLTLPAILALPTLRPEQIQAALHPTNPVVLLLAQGVFKMALRQQILLLAGIITVTGFSASGLGILAQAPKPEPVKATEKPAPAAPPKADEKATPEESPGIRAVRKRLKEMQEQLPKLEKELVEEQERARTYLILKKSREELFQQVELAIFKSEVELRRLNAKLEEEKVVRVEMTFPKNSRSEQMIRFELQIVAEQKHQDYLVQKRDKLLKQISVEAESPNDRIQKLERNVVVIRSRIAEYDSLLNPTARPDSELDAGLRELHDRNLRQRMQNQKK
ncbi:MAG: sigma-70 family RNA polymerase sigma factor [Fimbriiglobus sp.]